MDSMELASLYNELSSHVRLTILEMLREKDARFSEIVNRVELSSPEVSRHLKRLQDANLVEKQVEGGYRLSLFGNTVMRITSSMEPLMDKSDYFLIHDTSVIPVQLLRELEALEDATIETVFSMMGKMYTKLGATEYFWDIANQSQDSTTTFMEVMNVSDLDFDIRFIVTPDLAEEYLKVSGEKNIKISLRTMDTVNFSVTVSNNLAFFALPDKGGTINRNAYIMGESEEFIDWCKRLYLHFWEKAERY